MATLEDVIAKVDSVEIENKKLVEENAALKAAAKARADADELEVKHKASAADAEEKEKKDAEEKEKKDAEEKEKADGVMPLKANKKKMIDEEKEKKDTEEKEKKDDEEKEKKDAQVELKTDAKIDSINAENLELKSRLAKLENLIKPRSDEEHAAFADAQAKADSVFNGFGKRAPRPLEGESLIDYRKRLVNSLKAYSPDWKEVKVAAITDSAMFDIAEKKIYADAMESAMQPTDLAEGELRMISRVDPATNQRTNTFVGKDHFVKSIGIRGKRATLNRYPNAVH